MKRLYRPIGLGEFRLIRDSGLTVFPPRLEWQPIFYPVLNQEYARQIALDWNTKDSFSGYCGIVTGFDIPFDLFGSYDIQNVGGTIHNELWVPAEDLKGFNSSIIGNIEILEVHLGDLFDPVNNNEIKNFKG
ncbi:MAG: hypothetical protein ACJAUD_000617 [Crocinitomicaceae bacterium]|jgi:hypothetical protein